MRGKTLRPGSRIHTRSPSGTGFPARRRVRDGEAWDNPHARRMVPPFVRGIKKNISPGDYRPGEGELHSAANPVPVPLRPDDPHESHAGRERRGRRIDANGLDVYINSVEPNSIVTVRRPMPPGESASIRTGPNRPWTLCAPRILTPLLLLFALSLPVAAAPLRAVENARRLVAVSHGAGEIFLSWRLLASDGPDVAFNVYRAASPAGPWALLSAGEHLLPTNHLHRPVTGGRADPSRVRPLPGGQAGPGRCRGGRRAGWPAAAGIVAPPPGGVEPHSWQGTAIDLRPA